MDSRDPSRRLFCATLAAGAAAIPALAADPKPRARIRFGVIGCGGMGSGRLRSLVARGKKDDIEVVAVSDVCQRRLANAERISKAKGCDDDGGDQDGGGVVPSGQVAVVGREGGEGGGLRGGRRTR
ncbi:MAG: Gfo/Idh/MocA family oxidoreductase [Gemmataceae bacterium]|nr:Gfo/Idh/MocA family oxidoreductase [Gemmataceae bacterium]